MNTAIQTNCSAVSGTLSLFIITDLLHILHCMKVFVKPGIFVFCPLPLFQNESFVFHDFSEAVGWPVNHFQYICVCVKLSAGSEGMYCTRLLSLRISKYINRASTVFIYLPTHFMSQLPNPQRESGVKTNANVPLCLSRRMDRKGSKFRQEGFYDILRMSYPTM